MGNTDAGCPYCDCEIQPKPKRKKKCPHCGQPVFVRAGKLMTEFGAVVHDEEQQAAYDRAIDGIPEQQAYEASRPRQDDEVADDRAAQIVLDKKHAAAFLKGFQSPEGVALYPFIAIFAKQDSFCCDACRKRHGVLIPTAECTPEMLPPFDDCTNWIHGCRCEFNAVNPDEGIT